MRIGYLGNSCVLPWERYRWGCCSSQHLISKKWPLEKGTGFEAWAAHPCPNQIWYPLPQEQEGLTDIGCVRGVRHWVFVIEVKDFEVVAHTGQWWKIPGNTFFLLKLPQFLKNYRSSCYKFWNTGTKRYFEQLFPTYLRGTMKKFWKKNKKKTNWKFNFPAAWGIFQ